MIGMIGMLGRGGRPVWAALAASAVLLLGGLGLWLWNVRAGDPLAGLGREGRASGYNLLLVTLDTVRADRIGCYGYAQARTPTIDRLAERGVRWSQAISPVPLTLPAHASLLTGLDVPAHGVRNNGSFHLDGSHATLAEVLHASGYATGAFVAAYVLDRRFGLARGFDVYDDDCGPPEGPRAQRDYNQRSAGEVNGAALGWLRAAVAERRPFFAWVHYYDPHFPYAPPPEYARDFADRPYDGEIAYADAELGRLLAALGELGALDSTLVVVTADHGEGLGGHDQATHGHLIYDDTQRIPLVISSPQLFSRSHVVTEAVVDLTDIMPGVLSLLGVKPPAGLDGRRLWNGAPREERAVYVETMASWLDNGWAPLYGLRRLKDKLIIAPESEYYDLAADPGETRNLYALRPAAAVELEAELKARLARWPPLASLVRDASELDPEVVERLASLGYLGGAGRSLSPSAPDPKRMILTWPRILGAEDLSLSGQHEPARAEIEAVLELDPGNGVAWYIAAGVNRRQGRLPEAEVCLRKAIELRPVAESYVSLAQLLILRGERGASVEESLARAVALDPTYGFSYITRGDLHAMEGDFELALVEFEKALEVDPGGTGQLASAKIEQARLRLEEQERPRGEGSR